MRIADPLWSREDILALFGLMNRHSPKSIIEAMRHIAEASLPDVTVEEAKALQAEDTARAIDDMDMPGGFR